MSGVGAWGKWGRWISASRCGLAWGRGRREKIVGDRESSSKAPQGRKSRERAAPLRGAWPQVRWLRPQSDRANQQNAAVQALGAAAPPEARGPSSLAFARPAETVIAQEGTGRDAARAIGQLFSPPWPALNQQHTVWPRVHRHHRLRGQALAHRRQVAQQHGRGGIQARRPWADLPQIHLRHLRGTGIASAAFSARAARVFRRILRAIP